MIPSDRNPMFIGGGLEGAMALAAKILAEGGRDSRNGYALLNALADALKSMVMASSLVTYGQDPNEPLLAIQEDNQDEPAPTRTPADILRVLADAWEQSQAANEWEETTKIFVDSFRSVIGEAEVEKYNANFGDEKTLTVADILEGK